MVSTKANAESEAKQTSCLVGLHGVSFRYPSRPSHRVLRDLTLTVSRAKMVALVGETGCGKSTVFALLQQWYRPETGRLSLEGNLPRGTFSHHLFVK
jgi:ABC-type transport system involved in cytochrome bd biosynthesis fused ATPase/permease subunit